MRFVLHSGNDDSDKASMFCNIIHNLKQFSLDVVVIMLDGKRLYMQGLDSSHVSLFEIDLKKGWFETYNWTKKDECSIAINPSLLDKALSTKQPGQNVVLEHKNGSSNLLLKLNGGPSSNIDKEFTLPLSAAEGYELMSVPVQEYDVDLTIASKRLASVIDQLMLFGNNVSVNCTGEQVIFKSEGESGDSGEMSARIDTEDEVIGYEIIEGLDLTQSFSLRFLKIMMGFHSLSKDAVLGWGDDKPMTVKYDLGDESRVQFFMAPRVVE
jgi:proliferating cell nuclear antigen PCNA